MILLLCCLAPQVFDVAVRAVKKDDKKKNPHNQPALQILGTLFVCVFRAPADLNTILPVWAELPRLRHVPVSKSHLRR